MTTNKLLEILELIKSIDTQYGIQSTLDAVASILANLANSPADTNYQTNLASNLDRLESGVNGASSTLTLSDLTTIAGMGGEEYFDPDLARKVRASIGSNAMTPSVARDYVKRLATNRASFIKSATDTATGLISLGVERYSLKNGESDVSFTIPRDLFDNELGSFATELRFLDRLLKDLSEATLGKVSPAKLEALSTTVPIVSVFSNPDVLNALAKVVEVFLNAWKRIEEIRKVRADVAKIGVAVALDSFDEKIEETVSEVIEETVKVSLASYQTDNGRKSELDTALRQDFRRLFGQIERGLIVDFRAEAADENQASNSLSEISNIASRLVYPTPAAQPLLLSNGEILEGEITRTKKTTTTTKTVKSSRSSGASD